MSSDKLNKNLKTDWVPIAAFTEGASKLVCMRTPGYVKGRRLLYLPSLQDYRNCHADVGDTAKSSASEPLNAAFSEIATIGLNAELFQSSYNEGVVSFLVPAEFLAYPKELLTLTLGNKEAKTAQEKREEARQ